MRYKRNPKQTGSNLIDCTPQKGPCSGGCNQCYYNRDKSLWEPNVPGTTIARNKIVRMNALHDSNRGKKLVLDAAKAYKHVFFNTSIPSFDFPGPVVYTANPSEEQPVDTDFLRSPNKHKLMFVRLRVSSTNLLHINKAVKIIHLFSQIPVVLTLMAYYERPEWMVGEQPTTYFSHDGNVPTYIWKVRHVNEYWCPTKAFKKAVLKTMRAIAGNKVTLCGTLDSNYCKDCRNCEAYYWITFKILRERNGS